MQPSGPPYCCNTSFLHIQAEQSITVLGLGRYSWFLRLYSNQKRRFYGTERVIVELKIDPLVNYHPPPPQPQPGIHVIMGRQNSYFKYKRVLSLSPGGGMGSTLPPADTVCPSDGERVAVPLKFFMRLEWFPAAAQYLLCCCQRLCNVR